ncbi:MAG TPA: DUF4382 domain-containing protein [Candidatus Acidoferrum sp.]|nr:DUF4382 domain-containing protein [Candidatus Acidoferrum sp.]
MQVSRLCESCSGSNRVHTVVLSLGGIDVHSSANAVGESSGWQPLFPELGKQPRQVELLSEKMIALSFASSEELSIPAGSYDHVRLRVAQNQVGSDREPLLENRCGQAGLNCVIMADGQVAPLAFEANILEFRLTSQVTDGGSPFVLPDSNNELLIELSPVQSMAQPLGEATRSIVVLPTEAHLEPRPRGKAMQERERISPNGF